MPIYVCVACGTAHETETELGLHRIATAHVAFVTVYRTDHCAYCTGTVYRRRLVDGAGYTTPQAAAGVTVHA